ncbi:MAG TPA: hypothetical protein VNO33_08360 [Kofleriaceae bacterium]|nr:hypothetical protein [Kofleriaceae bacterium]
MARVVTASYESREDAQYAAERLIASGLTREEVSLLAPEHNGGRYAFAIEPRKRTLAGIGGGAILGLIIGAVCGALLALAPVAIPALDQLGFDFEGTGPVVSALMGAGAGAAAVGLLGGLFGLSRTKHEAVMRDGDEIGAAGYVLVGVAVPREMVRSAVTVMSTAGAHKIKRG